MTILEKLDLSDKTRAATPAWPEAKLRGKMLEALDLQIQVSERLQCRLLAMSSSSAPSYLTTAFMR